MQNPCYIMLILIALFIIVAPVHAETTINDAQAAKIIGKRLDLIMNSRRGDLYGLFPSIFPGGYEGRVDVSLWNKTATLEHVVVALVRWAGWNTIDYNHNIAKKISEFVSPQGFPYYAPDPTKRSIPYIVCALEHGLIKEENVSDLRKPIGPKEVEHLCARVKRLIKTPMRYKAEHLKIDKTMNIGSLAILLPGFDQYQKLNRYNEAILDLNSPGIRLFNAGSPLSNGKQQYFPLGPLETMLSVGMHVDKNNYSHQAEAIYGITDNYSKTVNGVGIWGDGTSRSRGARVWGGFLVAKTADGKRNDAQAIGLEVDIVNNAAPGTSPFASKTGIQIVGIGRNPVTNALQVIGAGPAKWQNGILFSGNSISKTGAFIGAALSRNRISRGIDFSNVHFSDAAILLAQGSKVRFLTKQGYRSAEIYTDKFGNGHLVLIAGPSGIRIANNKNTANIISINDKGVISRSSLIWRNFPGIKYILLVAFVCLMLCIVSLLVNAYCYVCIVKLKRNYSPN